jgi:hypothetical protein
MPRNRTISQSEALFVGPITGVATGYHLNIGGTGGVNLVRQLHRVQTIGYSASVTRTPVNQYGQLDALERIILEAPTVSLNFDYLVANTYNANTLGFTTDGSASVVSGILTKASDERNYFVVTSREGSDIINNTTDADSTKFTTAVGNGFISNFSAEGSVGNFPVERVTVAGLNLVTYIGSTGLANPAIVPSGGQRVSTLGVNNFTIPSAVSGVDGAVSAIRPGDITLNIPAAVFGPAVSDLKIQSYNISVPLSRQPLTKLGSPFAFSQEIQFPIDVTLAVEADLGDMITGDLSLLYCTDLAQQIDIDLRRPQCGGGGPIAVRYRLVGCKLDTYNTTSSIGANKRVSLNYVTTLGGPQATNGLFVSGSIQ